MATYQFVPEHNGIEIYFDVKPSEDVLEELRSNGWRWHRVKQCWFSKRNSETEKFAKTLCNESPGSKFQDKKESHPIELEETASFNYINSDQSIFSSVTITRKQQRYTISSTNNQITCCDCNRWISVHAVACPFCGCPLSYIAEHYYAKFDPEVIRQQQIEEEKRRQAEQKRIKQEQDKREKEDLINRIATCWYGAIATNWHASFEVRWRLNGMSLAALKVAAERADTLGRPKSPLSISVDSYVEILKGTNSHFQKVLRRLSRIKAKQDELPTIFDKEWKSLMSLTDKEFDVRIVHLMEVHKVAQEKAAQEAKRRQEADAKQKEAEFKMMCGRYQIRGEQLSTLIERYGSKEALLRRLQTIDEIAGDYRHKINVLSYIDSLGTLKELVHNLK